MMKKVNRWLALLMAVTMIISSAIYTSGIATVSDSALKAAEEQLSADSTDSIDAGTVTNQTTEPVAEEPVVQEPAVEEQPVPVQNVEIQQPAAEEPPAEEPPVEEPQAAEPQAEEVRYTVTLHAPSVAGGTISTWADGSERKDSTGGSTEEITEHALYFVEVTASENYEVESLKDRNGADIAAKTVNGKVYTYEIQVTTNMELTVNYKEVEVKEEKKEPIKEENKEPSVSSDKEDEKITEADFIEITVEELKAVYNGKTQYLPKATAVHKEEPTTPKLLIEYSIDGGKNWSPDLPGIKNVDEGIVTVYVKAYVSYKKEEPKITTTTMQILPKKLTVKGDALTYIYSELHEPPAASGKVDGIAKSDSLENVLRGNITYTYDREINPKENGTYVITPNIKDVEVISPNYETELDVENGSLEVMKSEGHIELNAEGYKDYYDGAEHSFDMVQVRIVEGKEEIILKRYENGEWTGTGTDSVRITYQVYNDKGELIGEPSEEFPTFTDAGKYEVHIEAEVSGYVANSDEDILSKDETILIKPRFLAYSVAPAWKYFGEKDPEFVAREVAIPDGGLIPADKAIVKPIVSRVNKSEAVGPYKKDLKVSQIEWGSVNPNNYDFIDSSDYYGNFEIKRSDALGFKVDEDVSTTYDGTAHSPTATATVNGEPVDDATIKYSIDGGDTWHSSLSFTDAGTYNVHVKVEKEGYITKQSDPNNLDTIQTIVINKRDLTVTADNETIQYENRENVSGLTYTYEGNVEGETPGFDGALALGKTIDSVGEYEITQGNLALANNSKFKAANYNLVYTPGTLTVKGTIEVKTTPLTAVYNGSVQTIEPATVSVSEEGAETVIQYSFDKDKWSDTPIGRKDVTINENLREKSSAGKVPVYVRALIEDEAKRNFYNEAATETTIEITPATLTVKADDDSKVYGEANPTLTGKISGYKGNDTLAVVIGEATYATAAEQFSPVNEGGYPITVDVSKLKSENNNYKFEGQDATLTVTKADAAQTITSDVKAYTAVYDGEQHTLADFTITGAGKEELAKWDADQKKMTPSQGTTVQFSTTGEEGSWTDQMPSFTDVADSGKVYIKVTNPNYSDAHVIETSVTIEKREVIINVGSTFKMYGTADPEFTGDDGNGGFLEKDKIQVTYSRVSENPKADPVGKNYPITASANGDKLGNYDVTVVNGNLEITASDALVLEVTNYTGTYDGKAHGVNVNVDERTTGDVVEGTTVEYSTDEGKTWSKDPVTRKDAGTTKLWVKASAPNYADQVVKNASIEVKRATIEVKANGVEMPFEEKTGLQLTYTTKLKDGVANEMPGFTGELALQVGNEAVTNFQKIGKIGEYEIVQHTLALSENGSFNPDNYIINYTGATAVLTGALKMDVANYKGTYDGNEHTVEFKELSSPDQTLVRAEFSRDGKTNWTDKAEDFTFTNVPNNESYTETFYVRAVAEGYQPEPGRKVTVTIMPAIVEVQPKSVVVEFTDPEKETKLTGMNGIESQKILTYDGNAHKIEGQTIEFTGFFAKEDGDSVGVYPIKQDTFALADRESLSFNPANYRLVVKEGSTATITGELHLSLEGYSGTYDSEGHGITVIESVADDSRESVLVEYSLDKGNWSSTPIELKDATNGPVAVYARVSAPNNKHYKPVEAEAEINIGKKEITIKANDTDVVYGEAIPELTASIDETGLAVNDSAADVLTNEGGLADGIYTTTAAAGSPAGNYDIIAEAGGLTSKNYDLKLEGGTLSITQAADLLLTVEGREFTYDGNNHTVGVAHGDGENTTVEYSLDNGATWSTEVPHFTDAGTYDVLVKATSPNYSNTPEVKGTITINPKDVTILVANATKTFGTEDPIFTGEVTGLVDADDLGNVVYGRADEDAAKENLGDDITITAAYTANNNYNVQVIPAKLTITSAGQLDAEVTDVEVVYGGTPNGLLVSVTPGATPMYSTDGQNWSEIAPTYTEAGVYEVYVKAVRNGYTDSEPKLGTITINAREIEITAASDEKAYDGAELTATSARISSGTLAEGEEVTSVTVRGSQTMVGSSANVASDVVIMRGDVNVTSNYAVEYVDGILTVNEAAVIVTPETPTPAPTPTPTAVTPPAAAAAADAPTVIAPPAAPAAAPAPDVNAPTAVEETAAEYDLTEVADTETPLANTNLDEHDCCVLHFILMLALLLLSVFATANLKKNQKRLFELRKEYELAACKRGLSEDDGKSKRIA